MLLRAQEQLELLRVIKVLIFCHFQTKIVKVSLSVFDKGLIRVSDRLLAGDGRNEAAGPSQQKGLSEYIEFIESSIGLEGSLLVLALDIVDEIGFQG